MLLEAIWLPKILIKNLHIAEIISKLSPLLMLWKWERRNPFRTHPHKSFCLVIFHSHKPCKYIFQCYLKVSYSAFSSSSWSSINSRWARQQIGPRHLSELGVTWHVRKVRSQVRGQMKSGKNSRAQGRAEHFHLPFREMKES